MELNHAPVIGIRGGVICYANSAAGARFPDMAKVKNPVSCLFSERILYPGEKQFVTVARIEGALYSVSGTEVSGSLYLSMTPLERKRGFWPVSPGLLSNLRGSLSVIGLCIDRLHIQDP